MQPVSGFSSGPYCVTSRGMVAAIVLREGRAAARTTPRKEAVMTAGASDPRLELTLDDLMTLSGAVAIALMTINDTDRVRYEVLATKLAFILMRTRAIDDARHEGRYQ